jgi:hypothetical protein
LDGFGVYQKNIEFVRVSHEFGWKSHSFPSFFSSPPNWIQVFAAQLQDSLRYSMICQA